VTADRITAEVARFLDDPAHAAATTRALAEVRHALGEGGAAGRAAAIAAEMLA
jgi:lipid-A-disaccharide synthase